MAGNAGGESAHRWSSNRAFLFAAIGAAAGLRNIWRFPYVAGENGGGAFVLIYLACIALIGIPLVMAEIALGARGRSSAVGTMTRIAREEGRHPLWRGLGWIMVLVPPIALTYYAVVGGRSMRYITDAVRGRFDGMDAAGAAATFETINANPLDIGLWHLLFIAATAFIVAAGVRGGLERAVKIMVPGLGVILLLLVAYNATTDGFAPALKFLFYPDFSKVTPAVVLAAVGQTFFSLAVAVGAHITYGAYLPGKISIARAAIVVGSADTVVALLAGLAIFPIVFSAGVAYDGEGLIFLALPVAFGQMPLGALFATLFFVLLVFAALTSSIGMLEPCVRWLEDATRWGRRALTWGLAGIVWVVGILAVLSYSALEHFEPLGFLPLYAGKNIFATLDFTMGNILIPVSGFLMAVFVGWFMRPAGLEAALGFRSRALFVTWRFLVGVVAPLAIAAIALAQFL